MEQFGWLGDGISDAAKRLLKKTPPLRSCASPGMMSPETRRAGSGVGPEGSPARQHALARSSGANRRPWHPLAGLPSPGAHPDPLPLRVPLQHLPTDSETNPRTLSPTARLQTRMTRRHTHKHTYTHTRVHALAHHLPFSAEAARATQESHAFIRASIILPRLRRPAAAPRQGKRWTCAGGSACRTARASARSPAPAALPAAAAEKPEEPQGNRSRGPRATTATRVPGAAGLALERARRRGASG